MMDGFVPVNFNKQGDVSISKNGITIPVVRRPMFPDNRCNYLENGVMIALQPSKDGDIEIARPAQKGGSGRIGRKDVTRRAAKTLGVTLGEKIRLNTWVDDGCLVFAHRRPPEKEE